MITEQLLSQTFPGIPVQRYDEIRRLCYLASDGALCVRGCAALALQTIVPTAKLPTRISEPAMTVLTHLQELVAAGVLTISGMNIHKGFQLESVEK